MVKRMKLLAAIGGLSAVSLLGSQKASANTLEIGLQEDGGKRGNVTIVQTTSGFNPLGVTFSGTYGDFTVAVLGGSADNGASLSDLMSATASVINSNLLTSGSHTLHLFVSEDDYTLPVGAKLNVESGLSDTVVPGTTLTQANIFQGFADQNNDLLGTGILPTSELALLNFTNGLQTALPNGTTFDTGSVTGVFNRTGNFSLSSEVNFELSAGGKANYSDHVDVTVAPLPATASMGLGLFGVIGAAGGLSALRRRRAAAAL